MTILYPSPIFGPIHSRRLGTSLGINLLPADGKCCTFDCIYCECGFNTDRIPHQKLPSRQQVKTALEAQLIKMQAEGTAPDVLTFAGNGEPTLHPQFPQIIDDTIALRNHYFPQAKVSVLTNATQTHRQPIFDALTKIDNNICKLDTTSADYITRIDRPHTDYDVQKIIQQLKKFGSRCIIQTIFIKGKHQNQSVDNTSNTYVQPWLNTLSQIQPREVMIYTIDRETPAHDLKKATPQELQAISQQVRQLGLTCTVAY